MGRKTATLLLVLLACLAVVSKAYDTLGLAAVGLGACVFALFWFGREYTDSYPFAVVCVILLAIWITDHGAILSSFALALGAAIFLAGLLQHTYRVWLYVPGALAAYYLSLEVSAPPQWIRADLPPPSVVWMSSLALAGLSAYARFERTDAIRQFEEPKPIDPPTGTRTTVQRDPSRRHAWRWAALSLACAFAAALVDPGAIVLPLLFAVVYLRFQLSGYKARPWVPLASIAAMTALLLQRHGPEPNATDMLYLWPLSGHVVPFSGAQLTGLELAPGLAAAFLWFTNGASAVTATSAASACAGNLAALWELRRQWVLGFSALALAVIPALPSVLVGPSQGGAALDMAFRSIFVISLVGVCGSAFVTAASLRALQAPARLVPAPGSLPRR